MKTPLTALERDLLACVERLVTACETSAQELSGLEARSTDKIPSQIADLSDCLSLLMRSQSASIKALIDLLGEQASYSALEEQLQNSLRLAKAAEEMLSLS